MMATVPHVTSGLGLRKFQADGSLLTRVYDKFITYKELVNPQKTRKKLKYLRVTRTGQK